MANARPLGLTAIEEYQNALQTSAAADDEEEQLPPNYGLRDRRKRKVSYELMFADDGAPDNGGEDGDFRPRQPLAKRARVVKAEPAENDLSASPSALQRQRTLQADPLARIVEPTQIFCAGCDKWIKLGGAAFYPHHWAVHKKTVHSGRTPKRTPAKRRNAIDVDAQLSTSTLAQIDVDALAARNTLATPVVIKQEPITAELPPAPLTAPPALPTTTFSGKKLRSYSDMRPSGKPPLRNEAQRLAELQADPHVASIEHYRIKCRPCGAWVQLSQRGLYYTGAWNAHKTSCKLMPKAPKVEDDVFAAATIPAPMSAPPASVNVTAAVPPRLRKGLFKLPPPPAPRPGTINTANPGEASVDPSASPTQPVGARWQASTRPDASPSRPALSLEIKPDTSALDQLASIALGTSLGPRRTSSDFSTPFSASSLTSVSASAPASAASPTSTDYASAAHRSKRNLVSVELPQVKKEPQPSGPLSHFEVDDAALAAAVRRKPDEEPMPLTDDYYATLGPRELERKAEFERDPDVRAVRPDAAQCNLCGRWIKLSNTYAFASGNWSGAKGHKVRCAMKKAQAAAGGSSTPRNVIDVDAEPVKMAVAKSVQAPKAKQPPPPLPRRTGSGTALMDDPHVRRVRDGKAQCDGCGKWLRIHMWDGHVEFRCAKLAKGKGKQASEELPSWALGDDMSDLTEVESDEETARHRIVRLLGMDLEATYSHYLNPTTTFPKLSMLATYKCDFRLSTARFRHPEDLEGHDTSDVEEAELEPPPLVSSVDSESAATSHSPLTPDDAEGTLARPIAVTDDKLAFELSTRRFLVPVPLRPPCQATPSDLLEEDDEALMSGTPVSVDDVRPFAELFPIDIPIEG